MTSIHLRYRLGASAILLLSLSGCRAFDRSHSDSNRIVDDIPGVTASSEKELNPAEAAKVCAATAKNLEETGDSRGAILMYERARFKDPKGMKSVCRRLAVLYDRAGDYQKAQKEYELALELSPKDPELLNNLGYCHYCRGKWQTAEEYFRKSIAEDKRYERAWINLGLALGQQEKYAPALAAFQNAVSDPEAHCNLAFIYLTQGKREEARQEYLNALDLDPGLQIASYAITKIDNPIENRQDAAVAKASDTGVAEPSRDSASVDDQVILVHSLSDQSTSTGDESTLAAIDAIGP